MPPCLLLNTQNSRAAHLPIPTNSTTTRNTAAYPIAIPDRIDTFANGENDSEPASGVGISYAARLHTASPGITRLDATPWRANATTPAVSVVSTEASRDFHSTLVRSAAA